MSREILFRGKDGAGWVYGDRIHRGGKICIKPYLDEIEYIIQPETLGEYTGLKDKNGNRIFEGDILSGHLDDLFPENETRLTVVWHETGWFGWNHGCHAFDDFENQFSRQFEIIGNIHENQKGTEV